VPVVPLLAEVEHVVERARQASNDWLPILPRLQLSSTKRRIEDWSVIELSTKFTFANGEITSSGWRGP
jgi:hypothetical protein